MLIADAVMAVGGEGADRLAIGVGTAAMIGIGTAMTMQGLFRSRYVLAQAGEEAAAEILSAPILLVTSISPGLLFPLSLLAFGVALGRTRVLSWPLALCLVSGAILFPLGRFIIGEIWLNVASDALFVVALGALARLSWRQGRAGKIETAAAALHATSV